MPVCIKKIMVGRLPSAVVCCFKVSFTIKWKKNRQIDERQLYLILSFEKYRVRQISAYICDSGLGFLEAISFLAEKTASPSHLSALRVFDSVGRQSFLFWFNSLIFWLVTCFFLEMEWSATNQGVFWFSTASSSSSRRLIALPPPPTPHRPL